jgi:hypothetical protein
MKGKIVLILCTSVFLFMTLTNPKRIEHQEAVKEALFLREKIDGESNLELSKLKNNDSIELAVANYFVSNDIAELTSKEVKDLNLGLFSITQMNSNGQISAIGIGALGKVVIWDDLKNVQLNADLNK